MDLRCPRPADGHPRPAPHGRRQPVRRRTRDGDEARSRGERLLDAILLARPGSRDRRADAVGRAVHPGRTAAYATPPGTLVIACGRYEGIDARVWEHYRDRGFDVDEVSIGDYVLAGGEAAALVMVEAIVRLLPGVLGNDESARRTTRSPPTRRGGPWRDPSTPSHGLARPAGSGRPAQRRPRRDRTMAGRIDRAGPDRTGPTRRPDPGGCGWPKTRCSWHTRCDRDMPPWACHRGSIRHGSRAIHRQSVGDLRRPRRSEHSMRKLDFVDEASLRIRHPRLPPRRHRSRST